MSGDQFVVDLTKEVLRMAESLIVIQEQIYALLEELPGPRQVAWADKVRQRCEEKGFDWVTSQHKDETDETTPTGS